MNNIAFPMAAVVGPKVFHLFDNKLINFGYKIQQMDRSALDDRLKSNNAQVKLN